MYILYVYTVLSYSCAVVVLCCSRGGLWKWGKYTTNYKYFRMSVSDALDSWGGAWGGARYICICIYRSYIRNAMSTYNSNAPIMRYDNYIYATYDIYVVYAYVCSIYIALSVFYLRRYGMYRIS